MRRIVFQRYFAIMCMNDGLTESKPQPKTSAAVANRIAPGKKHFKNTFLQFIWNTGAIIADAGARRSLLDCIVYEIDKDLHDKSRIHPY